MGGDLSSCHPVTTGVEASARESRARKDEALRLCQTPASPAVIKKHLAEVRHLGAETSELKACEQSLRSARQHAIDGYRRSCVLALESSDSPADMIARLRDLEATEVEWQDCAQSALARLRGDRASQSEYPPIKVSESMGVCRSDGVPYRILESEAIQQADPAGQLHWCSASCLLFYGTSARGLDFCCTSQKKSPSGSCPRSEVFPVLPVH